MLRTSCGLELIAVVLDWLYKWYDIGLRLRGKKHACSHFLTSSDRNCCRPTRGVNISLKWINHSLCFADIICSEVRTAFCGRNSIKTVSYEEQMISEDKYASWFSHQMEANVFTLPAKYFSTLMKSLAFFGLRYLLFCVLWYDVMNIQTTEKMRPR